MRFSGACGGLPNESSMGELGLTECVSTNQRQTGAGRCTESSLTLAFSDSPSVLPRPGKGLLGDDD